ncbi:MAG: hypothetical protein V4640_11805 [Verrucomicrobiota bacterium]
MEELVGGIRLEDFTMFAGGNSEDIRDFCGDGENGKQFVFPTEEFTGEKREMTDDGTAACGIAVEGTDQAFLHRRVAASIELDLAVHQCQRRDNKAFRLKVAEPALVLRDGEFAGIGNHGLKQASGKRAQPARCGGI